jgi:broad specificity phosphatase PhoE
MRLFILARHGQSALNVRGIMNGDPRRPVELTDRGEDEARRLGDQIGHIPIAIAFCTRFLRTRQTAEIALEGRGVPLVVEPALDDLNVGALDGHGADEVYVWKQRHRWSDPFPSGESLCAAARRYAGAFRTLIGGSEPVTLVVCHAAPIRYLLDAADGATPFADSARVVENAVPYLLDEFGLARACDRLDRVSRSATPFGEAA